MVTQLAPSGDQLVTNVQVTAILGNVFKRRWARAILGHVAVGHGRPDAILRLEPELPVTVLNQTLRTFVRQGVLSRVPLADAHGLCEYRLRELGRRIMAIVDQVLALEARVAEANARRNSAR